MERILDDFRTFLDRISDMEESADFNSGITPYLKLRSAFARELVAQDAIGFDRCETPSRHIANSIILGWGDDGDLDSEPKPGAPRLSFRRGQDWLNITDTIFLCEAVRWLVGKNPNVEARYSLALNEKGRYGKPATITFSLSHPDSTDRWKVAGHETGMGEWHDTPGTDVGNRVFDIDGWGAKGTQNYLELLDYITEELWKEDGYTAMLDGKARITANTSPMALLDDGVSGFIRELVWMIEAKHTEAQPRSTPKNRIKRAGQ